MCPSSHLTCSGFPVAKAHRNLGDPRPGREKGPGSGLGGGAAEALAATRGEREVREALELR